jgi:hypothetical protein
MASYRIVCTEQSDPPAPGHGHILAVGVGDDPSKATERFEVAEVRRKLRAGDRFYTVGIASGDEADVQAFDCWCSVKTIRSDPDQVTDNNLDDLRLCSWKQK